MFVSSCNSQYQTLPEQVHNTVRTNPPGSINRIRLLPYIVITYGHHHHHSTSRPAQNISHGSSDSLSRTMNTAAPESSILLILSSPYCHVLSKYLHCSFQTPNRSHEASSSCSSIHLLQWHHVKLFCLCHIPHHGCETLLATRGWCRRPDDWWKGLTMCSP